MQGPGRIVNIDRQPFPLGNVQSQFDSICSYRTLELISRERMTESLSTPDPPKSRRVREKARLGRPMGFTSWSDEEYIYDNMKNIEKKA
jgi:hypothetical protein